MVAGESAGPHVVCWTNQHFVLILVQQWSDLKVSVILTVWLWPCHHQIRVEEIADNQLDPQGKKKWTRQCYEVSILR